MARPHKGDRVAVSLRIPAELHARLTAEADKFSVDRHTFIIAALTRGLNGWMKS